MNTALHRRLQRLEQASAKVKRTRATNPLVEPPANATDEQWRLFEIRKAEAETVCGTIVVIRACRPERPIEYRARVTFVPPKIPAIIEVRPLQMEGNNYAH